MILVSIVKKYFPMVRGKEEADRNDAVDSDDAI